MTTDNFSKKKLVILGLARQGKALARFAAEKGASVVVSDLRSAEILKPLIDELADLNNVEFCLGSHPSSLLDETDYLAISGGVPADAPFVKEARARGITITNDSQEFLRRSAARVIGITGSAGKSTTTSLIGEMCRQSGKATWVGGNIGFPLIENVDVISAEDHVIQELSSFQLEIWTESPPIAAVLNITPNHLDRHKTMDVYTEAKANILRNQSADDVAILPEDELNELRALVRGRLRTFSQVQPVADGAFLQDSAIILRSSAADGSQSEQIVCAIEDVRLRGQHNLLNVLAAVTLADTVGVSVEAMRAAIRTFTGIAHRLELVATVDDIQFINDSIATAPERALAAIRSFSEPLVLLAGGRDKDLDWDGWAHEVHAHCKAVVLFGEAADLIADALSGALDTPQSGGKIDSSKLRTVSSAFTLQVETVTSLEKAVAKAFSIATAGDAVLLSPGGTSFDAYVDFAARGEHFREIAKNLE